MVKTAEKDVSEMIWQCSLELPSTTLDGESDSNHDGDVEMTLNMVVLLNCGHNFLILGASVVKLLFQALNSIAGHSAGVCVMPGWGLRPNKRCCLAVPPVFCQTRELF